MDMDGFLVRIPPAQADQLFVSASAAAAVIDAGRADPVRTLRLDEAWCALHFVLSDELPMPRHEALQRGLSWDDQSLENVLMGGQPTAYPSFFGPARYLPPSQIADLAQQLADLTPAAFIDRYDPDWLQQNRIFPGIWDDLSARRWLVAYFVRLVQFYHDAAQHGAGLVIYFL